MTNIMINYWDCINNWVQFVLALMGVVLSAVALIQTTRVRKTIAMQQFDRKQEEIMAELISSLNKKEFKIEFVCDNDVGALAPYKSKNVRFFTVAMDTKKSEYDSAMIFVSTKASNKWIDEFIYNPYLPKQIAQCLSDFIITRDGESFELEQERFGNCVVLNTVNSDIDMEYLIYPNFEHITCWNDYKKSANKVMLEIEKWYKEKGIYYTAINIFGNEAKY